MQDRDISGRLIDRLALPQDLRSLSIEELARLAEEIRAVIIQTVSRTGGHLAASLGTVELTLALLKIFAPPDDKIVWDVGHQAYAHKILTGRLDRFPTLRQQDGLSGFLKRSESPYDAFGAGHSGTALGAALGMAAARDMRGGSAHVVAVVGDGALSCGSSLEALNNVATTTRRFIAILNDNEMSIAANVGALSRHLGALLADPLYNRIKSRIEKGALRLRMGGLRRTYHKIEESIKGFFLRSGLFEELGLRYIGPIDGHNLRALEDALRIARDSVQPILLHVQTQKGRGYRFAEKMPEKWHGTCGFDVMTGEMRAAQAPGAQTYSQVFGESLERLAAADERIVAITAGMCGNTGLAGFARRFPGRLFDVGISEEHAAIFAAGLAVEGFRPVFAVYSTFAQRIVDYVIHDVCLQNLPVVFCFDRAGIVGDDGPTHHGVFDLPLFRAVPDLTIMQPADEAELDAMLRAAFDAGRAAIIRYPRGASPGVRRPDTPAEPLPIGKAEVRRPGDKVWIWALGDMLPLADAAADALAARGISAGVVNARFVKPLDQALLRTQAQGARVFVTIENGVIAGGFGSAVMEALAADGYTGRVQRYGWPDAFVAQGRPDELMRRHGLTAEAIVAAVTATLAE